ncbi:hypothetical protein AGMMS49944_07690 [Spirochaetia bacterium]|nr:hypothetical protein AGMMS49944_07690 [Spirochaetia bacterium]
MQIIEYTDFSQDVSKAFDIALVDEVIITNKNGKDYKLTPVPNKTLEEKSPLENVPGIKVNVTMQQIVEILRECRAGI